MKLGIVGSGMIVGDLLSFIEQIPEIELVHISGTKRSEEKLRTIYQEHHFQRYSTSYDELLNDEQVDTIYIALPNHLHYTYALQALEAQKNVILEKPMTSNIEEAKELQRVATSNRLFLWEAITNQYLPNYYKIKSLLKDLGKIKVVECNYSQYSSRYNAFKEGNILPAFDYTKSGGALMDLNIYNIHLLVALFGAPKTVQYQANIEKNIDTSGIITLDYGTFKAVLIGAKDCKAPIMTSIQGDQGCIVLDTPANNASRFKVLKNDQSEMEYNEQNGKHRMYFEFVEFVKIIEQKDYQRAEEMMEKSLIAMEIATKARQSAGVVFAADKNIKEGEEE